MRLAILVASVWVLAGCATYYKPGGTQQGFDQDKASCIAASYQQFPTATVGVQSGTGYNTPVQTSCQTWNNQTNCTSTGGEYKAPPIVYQDQNMQPRNAAFRSCMYQRGYSTQKP